MKRILIAIFAALMMVSLVACGDTSGSDVKEPTGVSTGSTEVNEDNKVENSDAEVTIEETVLVDEGGVKITAKSLSMDEFFGAELNLLIENDSGKDLTIQCQNASVNGYMIETIMSVDVVSGKKANDSITFMDSDLDACGIDSIADMEFSFHMFTTSDWETYLDTAQIQLKTSIADTYEYTFDDSGDVAYDADGIKVVIKGMNEDDSLFGPGLVVYIENNTDKNITVQSQDVSVNGFMADTAFSCDVVSGKKAVDTIVFFDSDLEESGISVIEAVELSFHIFDMESWDTIVDTDVVSITF